MDSIMKQGIAVVSFQHRYCACGWALVTSKQHVTGRCERCEAELQNAPTIRGGELVTNLEANR